MWLCELGVKNSMMYPSWQSKYFFLVTNKDTLIKNILLLTYCTITINKFENYLEILEIQIKVNKYIIIEFK